MKFINHLDEQTARYCIQALKIKCNHKAIIWLLKAIYDIDVIMGSEIKLKNEFGKVNHK